MLPGGIEEGWKAELRHQYSLDYMQALLKFIANEKELGKIIYPEEKYMFRALKLTKFTDVKIVLLGQDPYHQKGQANGLSFSVEKETRIPPSLKNIYKELESDLKIKQPNHGNLEAWATRGVLLLNSCLSVEKDKPGSHKDKGWEKFTTEIIDILNRKKNNLVFILWGKQAITKGYRINLEKHYVIESAHPSPLSAYKGFFGSKPFSKTNIFLKSKDINPINWEL
jgi:uracil-DNA glycosylase